MIRNKIINEMQKENKAISLERFIDICLFNNDGYYESAKPIGKSGDFITAPEISQLFGEILGLYIFNAWHEKFKCKFNLIELGPGNGTLLTDILRITKFLPNFHNCLNIHLIEKNVNLMGKQKKKINKNKLDNLSIKWHDNFANIDKKPAIIIANEFFDCFPIRQFQNIRNGWCEKMINFDQVKKNFFYQNSPVNENQLLRKLTEYKSNNIVELSEQRENYFKAICKHVAQSSGTIIIIDYGYYNFPGHSTLQSVYNHRPSNLLDNVGKQDITSLVDFKKFINIAKSCNLHIDTYCAQKEFLLLNGMLKRKNKIIQKCTAEQKRIVEIGYERLIDRKQMGSIFKFLVLSSRKLNGDI